MDMKLCEWSALEEGKPILVCVPGAALGVVCARVGDQARAWVNRCPHFGVKLAAKREHLAWEPGHVLCNVHYAKFDLESGLCVSGDCAGESLSGVPAWRDGAWVWARLEEEQEGMEERQGEQPAQGE